MHEKSNYHPVVSFESIYISMLNILILNCKLDRLSIPYPIRIDHVNRLQTELYHKSEIYRENGEKK